MNFFGQEDVPELFFVAPVAVTVVKVTAVAIPLPLSLLSVVVAETCAIPAFSAETELQYSLYTLVAADRSGASAHPSKARQLERMEDAEVARSERQKHPFKAGLTQPNWFASSYSFPIQNCAHCRCRLNESSDVIETTEES